MKRIIFIIGLAVAAASVGCNAIKQLPTDFPTPEPSPPAAPLAKLDLKRDAALEAEIAKIAAAAKGKVGVAAVVLETGDAAMVNADGHYPMQSVYKLPISMAVMDQIRLGKRDLDEKVGVTKEDMVRQGQHSPLRDANPNGGEFTIRELIRYALVESDGTASDVLVRVAGGPQEIQDYLTQIGIDDMKVVNTEKELGADWKVQYDNWATPAAAAELLRFLCTDAKNAVGGVIDRLPGICGLGYSQDLLSDMMASKPGEKRLKGNLPNKTWVAHKTGTSGTQNGITAATNDIGIIKLSNGKHIAIAVFVSDSPAEEKTREAVIAKIAKAVWDKWSDADVAESAADPNVVRCDQAATGEERSVCQATGVKADDVSPNFPFEVSYMRSDLNGDKKEEYIVWESSWAGTSGGMLWILQPTTSGLKKLFETEMTWTPIYVLKSKHNGWRDVAFLMNGGGVKPDFVTVRNNGKAYSPIGGKSYARNDGQLNIPDGDLAMGKRWTQSVFGPISDQ